ncbi:hypothetical protein GPECTOR_2g1110 [Gonium pectorale]|uniref:Ribosomal protein S13 n=1 Tax=Gonium pectorale TaxID=33097 RepID=A0A150H0F0_GONPE|nr:hypothetical protein GPECTOR_2g1110 [Gonium pectorale]|eukprot:KXZ55561.1 hypothetical protein GPECTOR_2g1110 [Gonium pectorale]
MVQIQRVFLPPNATFHIALQRVFGIGRVTSVAVSEVKDVKDSYLQKVTSYIEANFTTGDNLKRQIRDNVLVQLGIKSRRGIRLERGLPVSSSQTRHNAVTANKLRPLIMYDTSRRQR